VFHRGQYNERTRSLFFDPNDRSDRVRQNNERTRSLEPWADWLYINDLPDIFNEEVTLKLFADDVKLYSNIAVALSYTPTSK